MIFGREPAAIVGAIQTLLALLLSFGWLSFLGLSTQTDLAVVMSVVSAGFAVYLAYATSETLLAPVVELMKALFALGAIYSLNITTEQTGLLVGAVTALFALWQRSKVSPLRKGSFKYIAPGDLRTPAAA